LQAGATRGRPNPEELGASTESQGDPFAPTEFPKRWSDTGPGQPVRAPLGCGMRLSGGGCRPPVTSEDGYWLGLAPKVSAMK
jgi:hypothetical protein